MNSKIIHIEEEIDLKSKISKLKKARKKRKSLFISKLNIPFLIVIIIFISIYIIYKI